MIKVVKYVLVYLLVIELVVFCLFFISWFDDYGVLKSVYYSLFYMILVFNNVGFVLSGDSLLVFKGDIIVNLVIIILFIIGGLGFMVLIDIYK